MLQFGVFETMKAYANLIEPGAKKNISTVFFASSTASTSATLVTFPFYLLRTRLIAQGNKMVSKLIINSMVYLVLLFDNNKVYNILVV